LLKQPNVAWLMAGSAMSLVGDQFTLVALPWLVLRLTGDSLVLGLVLALLGLPRALFILLGGAVVDRFTPHRVLMLSKHASTVLLGLLAWLVLADQLNLALVYALALGIGLASAFGIPAATSILPQAVAPQQLQAANGLLMGLRQLSFFVGPLLAGGLVAGLGEGSAGLGWAFALDALSFALSAFALSKVRTQAPPPQAHAPVLAAVMEGLRSFWRDQALRTCLLYWAAVALLISGPVQIALPVLAHSRPAWGAAAFGNLLAAHGAGTLLGMLVSGFRPRWRLGNLGQTILLVDAIVGLLFMPMGRISALWQGMALLLAIGVLGGYMQVTLFTWIQRRVAPALLGRAMSVFLFIFVGLAPLSSALTGWLLQWVPLATMFSVAGASLLALVALAALGSPLRKVADTPVIQA
jgi:MFS family permease